MRVETLVISGRTVTHITLSKRNLLTLLSKLGRPESAKTIGKGTVIITAEDDEPHYKGRTPGEMHPIDEENIAHATKKT